MTLTTPETRELIELTMTLARIESINPTLDPTSSGEAELAVFVHDWMSRQGWQVNMDWATRGRPNVVGVIRGGKGPTLMINAHLDTVGGEAASFVVTESGGQIHGRGVLDTKGGLAATLLAGASLREPPPGDVVIAAVCDEEADSIGTTRLIETWHPDAAIVIEPTGLDVIIGHRGFGILNVELIGVAAHTGHREDGINAVDSASRLMTDLQRLDTTLAERTPHPHLGSPAIQVTRIDGGSELFTVPDQCTMSVEIRTIPEFATHDMAEMVSAVAARSADGVGFHHEWLIVRPPFIVDPDQRVVAVLVAALTETDVEPRLTSAPFWTDAALMAEAGIPSVVFGPGGHGIHSADERIDMSSLIACQLVLGRAMADFGSSGRTTMGADQ